MCECHDSEEEHEIWAQAELEFWRAERQKEKLQASPIEEEEPPCVCGHGLELHKHADECRAGDDCRCQLYRPA